MITLNKPRPKSESTHGDTRGFTVIGGNEREIHAVSFASIKELRDLISHIKDPKFLNMAYGTVSLGRPALSAASAWRCK